MDSADLKLGARVYNKNGKLMAIDLNRQVEIVARQHGQAAPANPSTDGSRQELWGTPTARDHKSGRGNEEREYKELTPMVERTQAGKLNPRWVETLMGLPVGWVMPSCKSPVTIEQTNFASSATESSLPPQSELLEF